MKVLRFPLLVILTVGLAVPGEDLGNGAALPGGDHVVGLDEAAAEAPGRRQTGISPSAPGTGRGSAG